MDNAKQEAQQVASILRNAARYIEKHGWRQGSLFVYTASDPKFPNVCALGAITAAATHGFDADNANRDPYVIRATKVLAAHLWPEEKDSVDADAGYAQQLVWSFNDLHDMSAMRVCAELRNAAVELTASK